MTTQIPTRAPSWLCTVLESRWFGLLARVVLTFVFWSAGISGLIDFPAKVASMRSVGLAPPEAYAVAVTLVQLGGAAMIIANRWAWLGAVALSIFLMLTVPVAHAFWTMPEPRRTFEFYVVLEHVSLMGGLMVAAALCHRKRVIPSSA